MKTIVLMTAALAALASGAWAAPLHTAKPAAAKTALICPVTGNKIASVKAAVGHSTYGGKTYYFCCPECKPRFDKNPAKIAKNAAQGKYEKMQPIPAGLSLQIEAGFSPAAMPTPTEYQCMIEHGTGAEHVDAGPMTQEQLLDEVCAVLTNFLK